jgi:hypothetical protein
MTPEQIAGLRADMQSGKHSYEALNNWEQDIITLCDEIERLGQLVRNAHTRETTGPLAVEIQKDAVDRQWFVECRCNAHEWLDLGYHDTEVLAHSAHRAHVDALIAGTA